jgi:hypothetical protein
MEMKTRNGSQNEIGNDKGFRRPENLLPLSTLFHNLLHLHLSHSMSVTSKMTPDLLQGNAMHATLT